MVKRRRFNAYEINQLSLYGKTISDISTDIPVEYVTGFVEFYDLKFITSPVCLIPRVETEKLVALSIDYLKSKYKKGEKLSILEVGCGSGAISIAIAKVLLSLNLPFNIISTDISKDCLYIAEKNICSLFRVHKYKNTFEIQNTTNTISLINSDLLETVPNQKFDLLVANLPYVPTNRISNLAESVKNFEPILALDGGKDGFEIIAKLLEQIAEFQFETSNIYLEIDDSHTKKFLKSKYSSLFKVWDFTFHKDYQEKNRFLEAKLAE